MGYQMTLCSEPDRGSVFRVMLPPVTQRAATPPEEAVPAANPAQ
jgi:hypothetical protein